MVPDMELPDCHTGIYARIWNTEGEGLYAPYHHCTSQLAASILMLPGLPELLYCAGLYNEGNTRKIQPLSLIHILDMHLSNPGN